MCADRNSPPALLWPVLEGFSLRLVCLLAAGKCRLLFRGVFPTTRPHGLLASTGRTLSKASVFRVCSVFQPSLVISPRTACQIGKNEVPATAPRTFSRHIHSAQRRHWPRLAISWVVLGPPGVTLNRHIGLPRTTFKARLETTPNVVISPPPDSLIPPNGRLASAACTFKHMRVFVVL